jgi:hypothetical protein
MFVFSLGWFTTQNLCGEKKFYKCNGIEKDNGSD